MFDVPPLFKIIQQESKTSWSEMYRVFNMGHRFEIYTNRDLANQIIDISNAFKIDAQIIGKVEASDNKKLSIKSEFGEFIY